MKRSVFGLVKVVVLFFMFCNFVYAKRAVPCEIEPVVYKGIKFVAPISKMGFVQAWNVKTGKEIWQLKVYDIKYSPDLEKDIQDVFITSLSIKNGNLKVVDEKGHKYDIDLETKKVRNYKDSK